MDNGVQEALCFKTIKTLHSARRVHLFAALACKRHCAPGWLTL
jgi:hypothetical protein